MPRFRWVVCQMNSIKDCLSLPEPRETMANLPETLDETYERIIKDLLKRNKRGAIDLL